MSLTLWKVFLISGIVLCLFASYAYLAPPTLKLKDQVSLETSPSYLQLSLKTFSGFLATKNITLGKLEIGDFVWIRVDPIDSLCYGNRWENDDVYIGYVEDIGAYLDMAKINGLWFYVYHTSVVGGDVVARLEASPSVWASLTLSTENGGVIDSKSANWNYSTKSGL